MAYQVFNKEFNSIEIYFDSKPDERIRDLLKSNGFRWHSIKKCWYAKKTSESTGIANSITDSKESIRTTNSTEHHNRNDSSKFCSFVNADKRSGTYGSRKYVVNENIISIVRPRHVTLELNKISWDGNSPVFDLRQWQDNKMKSGMTITEDEMRDLFFAMQKSSCIDNGDEATGFHRNEIVFANDHFKLRYLGIKEHKENGGYYSFKFEIENISDKRIRVDIQKVYICDCEFSTSFEQSSTLLTAKKKRIDDFRVYKKSLRKQWINKIWEYTSIEIEVCAVYSSHSDIDDFDLRYSSHIPYLGIVKLCPDNYIKNDSE